MAEILVTKPGTLNQRDRAVLRKAGVVCVEADDPKDVKLIQASGAELTSNDMLFAALSAISKDSYSGNVAHKFPAILFKLMEEARASLAGEV